MASRPLRVFVTGAAGFVGQRVVDVLLREGHQVWALSRRPEPSVMPDRLTWVQGDLLDPAGYLSALRQVDAVVHLAALLAARQAGAYYESNVHGTELLFRATVETGAGPRRAVLMSSIAAMGPSRDGTILQETVRCRPETAYGASKLQGEDAARKFADHLHLTVLRPTFVYGHGDHRGSDHLRVLLQPRERRWENGIERLSLLHVADLAQAALAALSRSGPSGTTYLLAEPADCGWEDVRAAVLEALDGLVMAGRLPSEVAAVVMERARTLGLGNRRGSRRLSWACDTTKARRELGLLNARSFASGVAEAIQSYCDAGFFAPGRWLGRLTTGV